MFGIVLICVLIGDLFLVVIDDDEDVICIEAPVPSHASTPRPVARNGGAVRVRFNGEGSKSAPSPGARSRRKIQEAAKGSQRVCVAERRQVVRRYATLILIFISKLAN